MTYCKKCWHESHCGASFKYDKQDWATYSVKKNEVCESCHCELCGGD